VISHHFCDTDFKEVDEYSLTDQTVVSVGVEKYRTELGSERNCRWSD